ncbi:MAG: alpha/beta fold hydrolase [Myxococcota bacterium]
MSTSLQLLRGMNQVLGRLAPGWAARQARVRFTTPRRTPERRWEAAVEASADRRTLAVGWSTLHWGPDRARGRVLCMHGWEGRATQFGRLAERLVDDGWSVVALDGPGHGASPEEQAHPLAFARALQDVDRELGPFDAAVGHSMGAGALGFALGWGLSPQRVALLASPSSLLGVIDRYGLYIGLPVDARARLVDAMAAHVGFTPDELDVAQVAASLTQDALVVHDPDDIEVPASDGRAIARHWPNAHFVEVSGVGHRGLLRDSRVLEQVAEFFGCP